jgi:hypothetical protein
VRRFWGDEVASSRDDAVVKRPNPLTPVARPPVSRRTVITEGSGGTCGGFLVKGERCNNSKGPSENLQGRSDFHR